MGSNWAVDVPELDSWSICYAWISLDDPSRPTDLPHGRHYGWTRAVHCHGYDLESTREGRFRLLRDLGSSQFGSADYSLLAICSLVH